MKSLLVILFILISFIACGDAENEKKQFSNDSNIKKEQQSISRISVTTGETQIEKNNSFLSYDLDGNRIVRISPDGEETPLTKELGALISIRNSYEKLNSKILAQRLSKNYILKCSSCHDSYANGVIGPSLLDKSESDIFNIIKAYQNKTKVNILMKDLILKMKDEEIRSLASEIANLNKEMRESK